MPEFFSFAVFQFLVQIQFPSFSVYAKYKIAKSLAAHEFASFSVFRAFQFFASFWCYTRKNFRPQPAHNKNYTPKRARVPRFRAADPLAMPQILRCRDDKIAAAHEIRGVHSPCAAWLAVGNKNLNPLFPNPKLWR